MNIFKFLFYLLIFSNLLYAQIPNSYYKSDWILYISLDKKIDYKQYLKSKDWVVGYEYIGDTDSEVHLYILLSQKYRNKYSSSKRDKLYNVLNQSNEIIFYNTFEKINGQWRTGRGNISARFKSKNAYEKFLNQEKKTIKLADPKFSVNCHDNGEVSCILQLNRKSRIGYAYLIDHYRGKYGKHLVYIADSMVLLSLSEFKFTLVNIKKSKIKEPAWVSYSKYNKNNPRPLWSTLKKKENENEKK